MALASSEGFQQAKYEQRFLHLLRSMNRIMASRLARCRRYRSVQTGKSSTIKRRRQRGQTVTPIHTRQRATTHSERLFQTWRRAFVAQAVKPITTHGAGDTAPTYWTRIAL